MTNELILYKNEQHKAILLIKSLFCGIKLIFLTQYCGQNFYADRIF